MHKGDLIAILSLLVGMGALASNQIFGAYIHTLAGGHGSQIVAAIGLLGNMASLILRVYFNPSPETPATPGSVQ